jgi:hypothetical protein
MQHIRKPGVALSIRRRMLDLIADMSCQSWASLGLETLGHNEYEREFDIAAFRQTQERPGSHANRTYHGGGCLSDVRGMHLHMSVHQRVHARSRLNNTLGDALVVNMLQIVLQRREHRRRAGLLCVRRPRGRCKSLSYEVGAPALYVNSLIVCTVADDREHARYNGRIVSTVA